MSGRKSKASRRAKDAKHVRLYLYMLKTPAWLGLSCQARCLLIELMALYNGTNNGELFMSVRTAATFLRTGVRQARAAFTELAEHGFIRATRKGAMAQRGQSRLATTWRLTEYDDDLTGRGPTKEFIRWLPDRKNPSGAPEDTHRGPRGHAHVAERPNTTPERGPGGHAKADSEVLSVAPEDTQLVNHPIHSESEGALPRSAHPSVAPCSSKLVPS